MPSRCSYMSAKTDNPCLRLFFWPGSSHPPMQRRHVIAERALEFGHKDLWVICAVALSCDKAAQVDTSWLGHFKSWNTHPWFWKSSPRTARHCMLSKSLIYQTRWLYWLKDGVKMLQKWSVDARLISQNQELLLFGDLAVVCSWGGLVSDRGWTLFGSKKTGNGWKKFLLQRVKWPQLHPQPPESADLIAVAPLTSK